MCGGDGRKEEGQRHEQLTVLVESASRVGLALSAPGALLNVWHQLGSLSVQHHRCLGGVGV